MTPITQDADKACTNYAILGKCRVINSTLFKDLYAWLGKIMITTQVKILTA